MASQEDSLKCDNIKGDQGRTANLLGKFGNQDKNLRSGKVAIYFLCHGHFFLSISVPCATLVSETQHLFASSLIPFLVEHKVLE